MDSLISQLFDYAPFILGAIGLYVVYQLVSRVKVKTGSGGLDAFLGRLLGARYAEAKLQRAVAREKKMGHFLGAGRLYEEGERLQEAVDVYIEGSEFFAAAAVLEKMGKLERAAELFLQSGDYKKAAQVFVTCGKPARAAALFLEKGNTLEAARLFGLAETWDKAGDLYSKSGYPLRAAEAYEKAGDFLKAAESHEKHFMENVSYATTYSSTATSTDHRSAVLAGRLYEKAGDPHRALQIYTKGGYFKEAASACMALGQFAKAAELFMRAEDPDSAADAFERAGDIVRAANLRGEVALKADRAAEAAAYFQQGQDYLRAAELFESVGMLAESAGAYEAGESYAAAGGVYIRAGLKDRAAASFERAGELDTAAKLYDDVGDGRKAMELYERSGQTFKSGEAAAQAGERDKAIALLQRVGAEDEHYRPATELLAQLFIETRMPGLAVERLQRVLGTDPVSPSNIDLYYWLAAGYEASGNTRDALAIYKKIQAEDLRYRDVEKRVARLQSAAPGRAAQTPAAAAPAGVPTAVAATGNAPASAAPRAEASAPAPPAAAPAPPSKTGRFVRKEEIGRGPLGVVYRAEDSLDGRSVALRILPAAALRVEGVQQGLVAELKAASQLSHPNIVKVLGFIDVGGERGVVTELVAGKNFADALKRGHKMSFQQVHGLGRVLSQALAFVHGKGLVHGSIQPSNIMVASGVVKVADMGLGRVAGLTAPLDSYRAPENRLDVAGDLFAMSAVLYHLLTGVNPRTQPQGAALPLPSKLAPGVPEAFDKLLLRCLHPREELRFASAAEVLAELKTMVRIG